MNLKTITFFTQAGGEQTLKLQDYESSVEMEYWSEPDKALSGKLRHNTRGARERYRISYQHCIEASQYRSLLNNIMSDLTSGEDNITLSEGSDLSEARVVVPTEQCRQQIAFVDTIAGFLPSMEFIATTINHLGSSYVESGYVNLGYVE